jgi:hypothetical protein
MLQVYQGPGIVCVWSAGYNHLTSSSNTYSALFFFFEARLALFLGAKKKEKE